MAMEDTVYIGDFPIESPISSGFPIATFDYQRVNAIKPAFLRSKKHENPRLNTSKHHKTHHKTSISPSNNYEHRPLNIIKPAFLREILPFFPHPKSFPKRCRCLRIETSGAAPGGGLGGEPWRPGKSWDCENDDNTNIIIAIIPW